MACRARPPLRLGNVWLILGCLAAGALSHSAGAALLPDPRAYLSRPRGRAGLHPRPRLISPTPGLRKARGLLPPRKQPVRRAAPSRKVVGQQDSFWVIDFTNWPFSYEYYQITATLRIIGQHCYVYVEDGVVIDPWVSYESADELLQDIADTFDFKETELPNWGDWDPWGSKQTTTTSGNIYNRDREAFGSEWNPGIDGDDRITILIYDIPSPVDTECGQLGVGGFFNESDEQLQADLPAGEKSNEREMIYVNKLLCEMLDFLDPTLFYVLAHEFQHMIQWNYDPDEELWINEGIALQSAEICGYTSDVDSMISFAYGFDNSLTIWEDHGRCNVLEDYGAAFYFMEYIREKYGGWDTIRDVVQDPRSGIESIEHIVQTHGHPEQDFADVFDNWVIANHFDDPDLGDAYHYETVDLIRLYVEYLNGLLDPGDPTFPVPFSTPEVQQHAAYPLEAYADSVGVWAANYAEFSGTPPGDFTVYFTGDSRNVWSCRTALTTPDGTTTFGPPMPLDPATQRGSASFSEVGTTYERATLVIANHADYGRPPGTPPNDLAGYTYQTVGPPPAGDVNGDSNVDVNDLALFRMAFGGTSGLGADAVCGVYDQKCDLDEDGDVDWDDFWAMWYNNAPYHEGWVPGDVTGAAAKPGCPQGYPDAPPDDYLDIWDLIAFAAHWNTDTQSANWDEVFDFADSSGLAAPAAARPVPMDGVVNIFDLVKFAAAWHTGSGPAGSATSKGRALAQAARPLLRLVGPGDGIVGVGDEVEVQVVADDVTSLTGFDFKVTYDATLLKLTQHEVRQGNFLAIRGGRALVMEDLKKPGIAWFSGALAARDSSLAPSGTGRLARLRFRVIAEGPIELELRDGLVFTDDVWAVTSSRRLGLSAVRFGGDNWRIPIVLKAGDATESQHFIGVVSALAEAAPSARSLSDAQAQRRLTFELPDGTRAASAYLPAARGTLTCRFTVEGLEPGTEVTLAWPDLSQAPKDRVPLLCDLDSGASIFVRTAPAYHFGSGAGGVRHFEIRFEKSKAAAGRLIRNVVVRPLRGGAMGIAFDLDASASVSVEVINVAGRRVRRLAADRTMAAGRATLTWDGRSDAGTPVPRGTYLLRAVARSADGRRSRAVAVVSLAR